MSAWRSLKAWFYPSLPSLNPIWHGKRRKGLAYRHTPDGFWECQSEQDRIFWEQFLVPQSGGRFLEVGGNGVVGSHTLGLETFHAWTGVFWSPCPSRAKATRESCSCQVLDSSGMLPPHATFDLVAIHQPDAMDMVWNGLQSGQLGAEWVIVENPHPDPRWASLLRRLNYRLAWFCHDDEYYRRPAACFSAAKPCFQKERRGGTGGAP